MQVDLLGSAQSAHALHLFHQHSPLVHCMTNDVVQTFTANTLLALGASPAMLTEKKNSKSSQRGEFSRVLCLPGHFLRASIVAKRSLIRLPLASVRCSSPTSSLYFTLSQPS